MPIMPLYVACIVGIANSSESNARAVATLMEGHFGQSKFLQAFVPFTIVVEIRGNLNIAVCVRNFPAKPSLNYVIQI